MANVRKSYAVYDSRPTYISASGTYGTLPYTPLGTAAGLPIERQKDPYMQFLTAYVAGDGVGLSFAPSATAVSEHVFRYYLANTGGLSGSLLSGYGLLDISQSNEYLDLVGSLSRGTGTGSNFETAVDYVNEVVNRLHSDFPNMKWSVRGVPFNHYFLLPAPSTTASESSFGTGNYFHPQHPTGRTHQRLLLSSIATDPKPCWENSLPSSGCVPRECCTLTTPIRSSSEPSILRRCISRTGSASEWLRIS